MVRTVLALSVVALVAMTGGCRMCVHPYDYCGPLYTGDGCGPPCDPMARAGSILSGGCPSCGGQSLEGQPIPDAEMVPDMVPAASGEAPVESRKIVPVPDDYTGPTVEPIPGGRQQLAQLQPIRTYSRQPRHPDAAASSPRQMQRR